MTDELRNKAILAHIEIKNISGEDLVKFLKNENLSRIESIRFLREYMGMGGEESKKLVHFSVAWEDLRAETERFHAEVEQAAIESIADSDNDMRRFDPSG